jgi:hypothetical protein
MARIEVLHVGRFGCASETGSASQPCHPQTLLVLFTDSHSLTKGSDAPASIKHARGCRCIHGILYEALRGMRRVIGRMRLLSTTLRSMSMDSLRQQKAELRKSIQASLKQLSSEETAKQC